MHWWQGAFTSVSKSQSRDDSVIPSDNGKPGLFSSRRHRLLSRARKLLQPIDVGSTGQFHKHSACPAFTPSASTSASASASPLSVPVPMPLPLPELHVLLQRDTKPAPSSSNSCGVPLPSPDAIKTCKEWDERERERETTGATNPETNDGHERRTAGQESRKVTENREKKHTKTASLESYVNITSSAPSSPFSGMDMSPHRNNDIWGAYYMTPPGLFQVWSAPDQPLTDSHVAGFCRHAQASSLDNSPLHSPRLMPPPSPPRLRESNAVHPLPLPPPITMPAFSTPLSPTPPACRPDLSGASLPSQSTPSALHLAKTDFSPEPTPIKSKWQKGKLIGRGTFGSVYVASNRETGALCAMKEVEILPDDSKSAECIRQLEQEIKVLSRLKHQNIVQYYGSEVIGDKFYIYLEYVHPGSINKFIHDHCGAITESVVRNFTRHILYGLAYLHSQKTIHRDIKGANLLVDAYGVVKLADFGMAKHLNGQTAHLSLKGSPYWMAPELLQSAMQTDGSIDIALAVDIWSLGCTIIEMMNGKPPWSEYEGAAAMFKVLKETPPIPETMSAEGKDFLQCCFRRNPAARPAASRLLDHPFVNYSHLPDASSHSHKEIQDTTQFLTGDMNKNWMLSNNFAIYDSFTPVTVSNGDISKPPFSQY